MRTSRALLALSALVAVAVLAGCGGGPSSEAAPSAAAGGAYPVTIEHEFGSTVVAARPERVVTVGLLDQDAFLALGLVPVGTTEWFGGFPGAIGPWAQDELGDAPVPQVLTTDDGLDLEAIAALQPDVIVGLYAGLDQADYDALSGIAPTVAQPAGTSYGIGWADLTRTVGTILDSSAAAEQLVQDAEQQLADAATEHPEFAGATGLFASPYPDGMFVMGVDDVRSRLLTALGFSRPADIDEIVGDSYGEYLSAERTDLLDVDALVWLSDSAANSALIDADPVYRGLDVARQGRAVLVDDAGDATYGIALSQITVLSLPTVLDRLVPQLAAAVDGDPATPVPTA